MEIIRALNEFLKLKEVDPKTDSFPADDDDGKGSMKILNRSFPKYTDRARINRVTGTVRLAVVFCSDGVIGPIVVMQGLPHGLTESSIEAASGVKFKPEMRDGKPVTVVQTVTFTFQAH